MLSKPGEITNCFLKDNETIGAKITYLDEKCNILEKNLDLKNAEINELKTRNDVLEERSVHEIKYDQSTENEIKEKQLYKDFESQKLLIAN
jgi:hypothetical protein